MLHNDGGKDQYGAETRKIERVRSILVPPLQLPKTRRTTYLATREENQDRSHVRFSLDAGTAAAELDALSSRGSVMMDHDHGLGVSGLRRIRQQHNPHRTSTLLSPASRAPSLVNLTRFSSLNVAVDAQNPGVTFSSPSSPTFTEDLSRFPSESLHSFSFAHQTEEFLHNRQSILKRSMEFMQDRMGWSAASSAAIASAQARVSGDVETQNMLDLLAKANLVGAGNLPGADTPVPLAPLTGPAEMSGENVFEKQFAPGYATAGLVGDTLEVSPTTSRRLDLPADRSENGSTEESSRTPTIESGTTAKTTPPPVRRPSLLKRTFTDTSHVSMQQKLEDAMAKTYQARDPDPQENTPTIPYFSSVLNPQTGLSSFHGHSTRWVPAAQAIFTTESKAPWTILAANDLACLVFGVTKGEVRKMGILEVVQKERRAWLAKKLQKGVFEDTAQEAEEKAEEEAEEEAEKAARDDAPASFPTLLGIRGGGITARLLSKPSSRSQAPNKVARRPATIHSGEAKTPRPATSHHHDSQSRGVLLCGDVVPIQKRNGATGSASLWVKEKKVGLIWVLEEIREDVAHVSVDEEGRVTRLSGALGPIWGSESLEPGLDIGRLVPRIPRQGFDPRTGPIDWAQMASRQYYTCRNCDRINVPATLEQVRGHTDLRVSSFPHIAGIMVVDTDTLNIKSSNSVFCSALFGHEKPDGMSINSLVPNFDKILRILTEEDRIDLDDGIVIPEHSFRKASACLARKEGRPDGASSFLCPDGLPAKHRDGSELKIDVQMRIVKSETQQPQQPQQSPPEQAVREMGEDESLSVASSTYSVPQAEMVYALWITYSRHLRAARTQPASLSPDRSEAATPMHQPSPGQTPALTPPEMASDSEEARKEMSTAASLTRTLKEVAKSAAAKLTGSQKLPEKTPERVTASQPVEQPHKKSIDDFCVVEEMGQGAYGQVKLARCRKTGKKSVLKYVTKRRILVDMWTRDRRLGTVPLEIHVLDYLRRDGLQHPNIVEMEDFFEDETNYYIEMTPHGHPGMDLFDYIELRANMEEGECRSIFVQVARAIHHLHTNALVVHRDVKDENVILDGEGNIKLIDFGSAAYIKSGPFDVFVGTIDYAAPEVLAGKPYHGKEQDVWALGILLYTIIYKENPFYSIDEIMDRDLRVPYTISEASIDLIRHMLTRDVRERYDIDQVLEHAWCQLS